MADPTERVRRGTYERDGWRCIRCGRTDGLSYQHRQAVGMGGSDIRPTLPEGVTLCIDCNVRCESDLQAEALLMGWKVRRWVKRHHVHRVPVYDAWVARWFVLSVDTATRKQITQAAALKAIHDIYGEEGP